MKKIIAILCALAVLCGGAALAGGFSGSGGQFSERSNGVGFGGTGANDAASALRRLGGQPRYQICGTRTSMPNGTASTVGQAGHTFRWKSYLPYGGKNIRLIFGGYTTAFGAAETSIKPASYYAKTCTSVVGGTGYTKGDLINPTVASNNTAPQAIVDLVDGSGTVLQCSVVDPGLLYLRPADALATTSPGAGDDALTVTFGLEEVAYGFKVGLEQAWGVDQAAYSGSNLDGVLTLHKGFTYGGRDSLIRVPSGGFVWTDPNPNQSTFAAGTSIGIRMDTNGFGCARELPLISGTEHSALTSFTNYNADLAWGGTYGTSGGNACGALAIMCELDEPKPSFVLIGDSILTSGATIDSNGYNSWIKQAVGNQQPWTAMTRSGDQVGDWLDHADLQRMMTAINELKPSHCIDALGTNDFSGGASYATVIAKKIAFWSALTRAGCGTIWVTTITPYCTCATDCSSADDMTAGAGNTATQTYNTNARANAFTAYNVSKTIDVAVLVESPTKAGTWIVGETADCVHPDASGHELMRAGTTGEFTNVSLPQ